MERTEPHVKISTGAALAHGWLCHKKIYNVPPKNIYKEDVVYPPGDRARERLMTYWLDAKLQEFDDPGLTFLDDAEKLKEIFSVCADVNGLDDVRKYVLCSLFDSLDKDFHLDAFKVLHEKAIGENSISPVRLIVITGLVLGATTQDDLARGLFLLDKMPGAITDNLIRELIIGSSFQISRNSLTTNNWENVLARPFTSGERVMSLALIPDLQQRHTLFFLLGRTIALETKHMRGEHSNIAYKVSELIEDLAEGSQHQKDKKISPDDVKKVFDVLRPLQELPQGASREATIDAIDQVNNAIGQLVPRLSGSSQMSRIAGSPAAPASR